MFGVLGVIGDDTRTSSGSCRASHDDSDRPLADEKEPLKTCKSMLRSFRPHRNIISLPWSEKSPLNFRECARNRPAKHVVRSFPLLDLQLCQSQEAQLRSLIPLWAPLIHHAIPIWLTSILLTLYREDYVVGMRPAYPSGHGSGPTK
jgi:hypothetical protein